MRRVLLFFVIVGMVFSFEFGALDPPYWHGLVIYKAGKIYGFRFAIEKDNKIADGYDTFFIVHDVGPFAPDGSYAELSFDTTLPFDLRSKTPIREKVKNDRILYLRYGKYKDGIVGWVEVPRGIKLRLIFYSPWGMGVKFIHSKGRFLSRDGEFIFLPLSSLEGIKQKPQEIEAEIEAGSFFFYAGFEGFKKNGNWIRKYLRNRAREYNERRPKIRGEWEGLISSITNNLFWMRLLQPERGRIYIPAGRRWIFPGPDGKRDWWTMFEWDSFFNALEASVEDCRLAKSEIEAVLDTQYPWGNIPNWRSAHSGSPDRAQPPVGAFTVLKTYLRCGDISILRDSFERLKKFHFYWSRNIGKHMKRDGNDNGLYEWGSDTELIPEGIPSWEKGASGRKRAAWESGQDDLPNFDSATFNEETNTLEMDCLDLSSLYALDAWALSRIASILNIQGEAKRFEREYVKISSRINELLWNPGEKFYFDRRWNGSFSHFKASSNFYPLTAGIASSERGQALLKHLLNPKEFWGDFVIPTISRDNPAFNDQQYWRGTIWPPTNYLVYKGLKRYKYDKVAAEFAVKGAKLFLYSWKKYHLCRENYNSITGEGGGQRYQSWGPLFALALLEEFIDISPTDGLTVGNLAASGKSSIENIWLAGKKYNLIVEPDYLSLYLNGTKVLEFKGRGVLRNIDIRSDKISLDVYVHSKRMEIRSGKYGKWKSLKEGKSSLELRRVQ